VHHAEEEAAMRQNKEELKARLMTEAEATIDKLLAGASETEELQLSDIERLARSAGQRMMERFTVGLVEAEAEAEESDECPQCKGRMRYKGRRGRNLVAETGEVRLEREYYYCPTCRKGFFPPRPKMGTEQDDLQSGACAADGVGERLGTL
jgi:hypothetical protein